LSIVCSSHAQTVGSSSVDGSTNSLAVQIWSPSRGEIFHAPATIHINAYVTLNAPVHAGDFVAVEFFANTNDLGSGKCVWHDAMRPQPRPGQPTPMYVIAPGFSPAQLDLSNMPAGGYALTTRATFTNGISAISAPVNITVLP
jgi:hypothetical protein